MGKCSSRRRTVAHRGFGAPICFRTLKSNNTYFTTCGLKRGFPMRGIGTGLPIRTFPAFYTTFGDWL
ncbi:MAG: hypothetical protein K2H52_11400 [Lachnospiraceae bacterium]|nr:hypothetical protein [Lachnospiraceae bacterium]